MKKEKYGFGLVGIGMGGETHATNFAEMDNIEFVACYGRSQAKADAFAEKWNANKAYSDYEAFCNDPDLDFVVVCSPNGLHAEHAVPLAKAGKHVIVEKPLDVTREAADAIIAACEENNVTLSVIYQMRFGSAAQKIKKGIEDGLFGDILEIDCIDKAYREISYYANDAWRGTKELEGGGTLTTQTTHLIDLMQWLGGEQTGPVKRVYGKTKTAFHDIDVEDLAHAIVTFENGALGNIISSTCFKPAMKSRVEVHGTKGSAIFNGEYDELYLWEVDGDDEKIDAPEGFQFKDITDPYLFPMCRHGDALQDAIKAVEDGTDPMVTGEEALKALDIKLAVYKSAEVGKELDIN